jgi:hypothetical protein
LEMLVETFMADGRALPKPDKYVMPSVRRGRSSKKTSPKRRKPQLQKQA